MTVSRSAWRRSSRTSDLCISSATRSNGIRSHYEHRVALGAEREPIERALLDNPIYVDYSVRVPRSTGTSSVPREQLRVMTTEALRHDRSRSMHDLYSFLGVDAQFVPASLDREFYKTGERRTYPPALWTARRLLKRYVPQSKRAKEFVDSHMLRRPRPASGPVERLRSWSTQSFPCACKR